MSKPMLITPIILSGGAGTRLWPSSRGELPKQFLPLMQGKSTFENTLLRVADRSIFSDSMVVTGHDFRFLVADMFARTGQRGRIVLEPMRRDSAAAIAVAAELQRRDNSDALLLILAADHLVTDIDGFVHTVKDSAAAARNGSIITFGITPDMPSTDYGYIEQGEPIDAHVRKVTSFKEKPKLPEAALLVAKGCLWNSGNFLARADVLLQELETFEPGIAAAARDVADHMDVQSAGDVSFESIKAAAFAKSPAKSIDYAVMERTKRAAVIPARFTWSDIGSWDSLWQANSKDPQGNAIHGSVAVSDVANSYISSHGLHTVVVGLDNITVVATHDAVLVARRQVSSELKPLVAALESSDGTRHLAQRHRKMAKPWGQQDDILRAAGLAVRILHIKANSKVEQASAPEGGAHLVVVAGTADIIVGGDRFTLQQNESRFIAAGVPLTIGNTQAEELHVVEVLAQSGGSRDTP